MPKLYKKKGNRILCPIWGFSYNPPANYYFPLPEYPEGDIEEIGNWKYKCKFPIFERNLNHDQITIELGEMKSGARIFHDKSLVIFDTDLWNTLKPYQRLFMVLHEKGHKYYSTEVKCDIFAALKMRKMGFPWSVIFTAQLATRPKYGRLHNGLINYIKKIRQ